MSELHECPECDGKHHGCHLCAADGPALQIEVNRDGQAVPTLPEVDRLVLNLPGLDFWFGFLNATVGGKVRGALRDAIGQGAFVAYQPDDPDDVRCHADAVEAGELLAGITLPSGWEPIGDHLDRMRERARDDADAAALAGAILACRMLGKVRP